MEFDGRRFDSIGECDCYKFLQLLHRAGEIGPITCQPKIYLTEAKILYKPDFAYQDLKTKVQTYVDYKGTRTAVFQLKQRIWRFYGPGPLLLMRGYGLNIEIIETIMPVHLGG